MVKTLYKSSEMLGLSIFDKFGKIKTHSPKMKKRIVGSKQTGLREKDEILISGVISFDIMVIVKQKLKLDSNSLNAIAKHVLGKLII